MRDAGPADPFAALHGDGPALAVHEGVLALPDQLKRRPLICGLFDATGAELPGEQCWLDGSTPATLPPEDRPAATEALEGTHLFGGVVSKHFGHVLCGGTARLWALDHCPCAIDGIVFFGRDPEMPNRLATRARGILGAFGIDLPVRIIDAPTRIERVVMAAQGFGVEDLLVGTPAYRRAMRARAGAPEAVPADGRRLYVSRAKQAPRRGYTIGEAVLQDALAGYGFEIVHPEDLGLAAQLALYREAACIVASDGSALHVAGFAAPTGCHVVMLQRREGPTLDHIADSLGRFLGCPPDVIRADRHWTAEKPRIRFSFTSVAFSEVGRALGLPLEDRPAAEVEDEVQRLGKTLGVVLREG